MEKKERLLSSNNNGRPYSYMAGRIKYICLTILIFLCGFFLCCCCFLTYGCSCFFCGADVKKNPSSLKKCSCSKKVDVFQEIFQSLQRRYFHESGFQQNVLWLIYFLKRARRNCFTQNKCRQFIQQIHCQVFSVP